MTSACPAFGKAVPTRHDPFVVEEYVSFRDISLGEAHSCGV